MHLKKKPSRLYNPEANYKFEKWLPDHVIRNITEDIFGNMKIYGGERRRYGGAGRRSSQVLFKLAVANYVPQPVKYEAAL